MRSLSLDTVNLLLDNVVRNHTLNSSHDSYHILDCVLLPLSILELLLTLFIVISEGDPFRS
jgi:hypothetical protein